MPPSLAHLDPSPASGRAFSVFARASSDPGAKWVLVDAEHLPRQAYELVVACAEVSHETDVLAELVSLRNSLTREGKLLLVMNREGSSDFDELATRAGFSRVRWLGGAADEPSTFELRR